MSRHGRNTVFMMDLWATVPYYTAYLSRALVQAGVDVMVGSITYYLDRGCFTSRGLRSEPGLLDLVGKRDLAPGPRRALKLGEAMLNMGALAVRFLLRPPAVVHVQYLPLLRWRMPVERWLLRLCRWRGSRILLTVHDLLPHDSAQRYLTVFRSLYHGVDALVCHSEPVRGRLIAELGVPADRISVIPHGPFFYDLAQDEGASVTKLKAPGEVLVLWQGILHPYKGVDILLEAWKRVEQRVPRARLLVVGPGSTDLPAQLRSRAEGLGLQRFTMDTRFISTEELVSTYQAADVVVYPYTAITTSGALATGLALGKTIVASDLPVFRELLEDGRNALLVPPGDSVALAEALASAAEDCALRDRLAAEVRAMEFGDQTWQSIAERTVAVYRTLQPERFKERSGATSVRVAS